MKRRLFLLLGACLWLLATWAQSVGSPLVLVTSARSPIERLSPEEARKLYLGVPVLVRGQVVKPVHNRSDPICEEMFLQRVMFMSAEAYERQVLSRIFRSGGSRPPAYAEASRLLQALLADPMAVSYMKRDKAAAAPGIKIIGEP